MNGNIFGPGAINSEALYEFIRESGGINTRPGIALHVACEELESAGRIRRTEAGHGKSLWQAPDERGLLPDLGRQGMIAKANASSGYAQIRKRIEQLSQATPLVDLCALYFLISEGVILLDDAVVERVRKLLYLALTTEPGNAISGLYPERPAMSLGEISSIVNRR